MSRFRGILTMVILTAGFSGCREARSPSATVEAAIESAQAGRQSDFLDCFEPRSRALLGMFWAVSSRYGYLSDEALMFVSSGAVEEISRSGAQALVRLSHGQRSGSLSLRRIEGRWLIDLLSDGEEKL